MKTRLLQQASAFAMLALIAISVGSCKKSKGDEAKDCALIMANVAGTYKLTALKYKPGAGLPEQDALPMREACENDDLIILKSDGTYLYQDAGTVCTPSGTDNGTWSLNGKILSSDGDIYGTVKSFDCKSFVYYIPDIYNSGDQLTFTLTKQ